MKFFRIPMTTHETPSAEQVAEFLKLVDDPANQPVYVHCQGGRHRTGVMTAVYRMSNGQWTADQAFAEMKRYRYGADFLHPEFKQFVYGYEPAVPAAPGGGGRRRGRGVGGRDHPVGGFSSSRAVLSGVRAGYALGAMGLPA